MNIPVNRTWGQYTTHHQSPTGRIATALKTLVVAPGQALSMQRHRHRSELWMVAYGTAYVYFLDDPTANGADAIRRGQRLLLQEGQTLTIPRLAWHQLHNTHRTPLVMYEIQYGVLCREDDIERYGPTEAAADPD